MADWALPTLADLKVDVLGMLKSRETDAYTLAESPLNPPVGAKRWNTSRNVFQAHSGGDVWVDMIVGIAGGGTGASNINDFLSNFNLGSMALQNSNNVNITGGIITGLSGLNVLGNADIDGVIYAGSANTAITNSAGKLNEVAIDNIANIAHINFNEVLPYRWIFAGTGGTAFSSQLELRGGIHPALILNDINQPANEQKARIAYYSRRIEFGFLNDTESAHSGTQIFFDRNGAITAGNNIHSPTGLTTTGAVLADGVIYGSEFKASTGHYRQSSGSMGLFMNESTIQMFSDIYYWTNKANNAHKMVLDASNVLTVVGAIVGQATLYIAGASTLGATVTINSQIPVIMQAPGWIRMDIADTSQGTANSTFAYMNYGQHLYIVPTSSPGNPIYSDWARSIRINRDGAVRIGGGGLEVTKILPGGSGNALQYGTYTPTDVGSVQNVTSVNFYSASYLKVGNVWTVAGQFDMSTPGTGLAWVRCQHPAWYIGSVPTSASVAGKGTVTSSAAGETGYASCQVSQGHVDLIIMVTDPGLHGYFYTYTFQSTS